MSPPSCDASPTAEVLAIDASADLSAPEVRREALETLEGGGLVLLPGRGFELTARERDLISDTRKLLAGIQEEQTRNGRPTILYEPWRGRIKRHHFASVGGRLVRARVQPAAVPDLEAMMARFGAWAGELLDRLFPRYGPALVRERITYRPHGRRTTQALHVDSAYGYPTQGRGMLRVFCNVDPAGRPRVWQVGEPFEPFARRFVASAHPRGPGFTASLLRRLGIVRGSKTAYDRLLAEIRRMAKHDRAYQSAAPRRIVEFPSASAWIAITDLVLHGAVSGQHSLDQTFLLPAAAMADPSRSSLRILERLTGRALV
jgi:hypothetical protein